jgi:sterol desaturase/sphingolipid hydroxylase (fatty acid hydroxylase superfamily)
MRGSISRRPAESKTVHSHANEHATTVPAEYHEAITASRKDLTSLGACWREFLKHFSGWAVASAIIVVGAIRIAAGGWSYRDLLVPVIIVSIQPFVEWIIHKYLLHLKPFTIGGKQYDLYTAKAHRRHHKAPAALDRVLLHPPEIISSMVLIALTTAPIIAGAITLVFGGSFWLLYGTALLFSYIGLFRYEWSHFLIHTPYIPKTRFFRSIWRSHRLHHFKHEDYWMGVSSNIGDRVFGTFPKQGEIAKSPTARTLGVTTERYDAQ